ncbi:ribosome small subunit-dependent GTPase A [Spiroplasma endosymbiont of Aspidapion aeneum]|uniref:ribosome small subunit-dependent GTPase A n=1 Tax=Spiroplasma endosymbiont of Aspidapion aeneum TaxID=3066276 RepID=UPI00313CE4DE
MIKCIEKGKDKFKNIRIELGDYLDVKKIDNSEYFLIEGIRDRRNLFYRPRIANVDQVFIIVALKQPNLNTLILNRYILLCKTMDVILILCFTKTDLDDNKEKISIAKCYEKLGYKCLFISNKNDKFFSTDFNNMFKNKITLFSGQSGSGKSTLINRIGNNLNIRTQDISKYLDSGKHTTTNSELYYLNNGYIADTPGFSKFQYDKIFPIDIARSLKIFLNLYCKFNDCLHINNTIECGVIKFFNDNIDLYFYKKDYDRIISELILQTKNRGDYG